MGQVAARRQLAEGFVAARKRRGSKAARPDEPAALYWKTELLSRYLDVARSVHRTCGPDDGVPGPEVDGSSLGVVRRVAPTADVSTASNRMLWQLDRHALHAAATWFHNIRPSADELMVAVAPEIELSACVARLVLEHLGGPMVLLSIVVAKRMHQDGGVQHPGGRAERDNSDEAHGHWPSRCLVSQVTTQERHHHCCDTGSHPPTRTTNRPSGVLHRCRPSARWNHARHATEDKSVVGTDRCSFWPNRR